jgi:hypothetical protein
MTSFFKRPATEYSDPVNGERWKAEDTELVTNHFHKVNAKVNEQIKDAVSRGIKTGIKSEPGALIPPPPSMDPFHGKKCTRPGLPGRFGKPGKCGRQAVGVIQSFKPEVPDNPSIESQAATASRRLAMDVYGGGYDPSASDVYKARMFADAVPQGGMVRDPLGPDAVFVCPFHAMTGYKDSLHPDDGGVIPSRYPVLREPVMGLDKLNPARHWRTTASDPNFCSVSDGITTVLVHTRDWIRFLAENGALPEAGQPL